MPKQKKNSQQHAQDIATRAGHQTMAEMTYEYHDKLQKCSDDLMVHLHNPPQLVVVEKLSARHGLFPSVVIDLWVRARQEVKTITARHHQKHQPKPKQTDEK